MRGMRWVLRRIAIALGVRSVIVSSDDGRRFCLDMSERYLWFPCKWEPGVTQILRSIVRPGDTVVDVGASIGWFTTLFAEITGQQGSVHAFEPNPVAFHRLQINVNLNPSQSQVHLHNSAVGAKHEMATLHVFGGKTPLRACLSARNLTEYSEYECELVTLDSYFDETYRGFPSLIKCDVEGYEVAVIQGSTRLLSSLSPPIWMLEVHPRSMTSFGHAVSDLLALFRDAGDYAVFNVRGAALKELTNPYCSIISDHILCVPACHQERLQYLEV